MKYALIALLIILNAIGSSAQEQHRLYTDVGSSPGFSATYNYNLVKYVGVGMGVQGYDTHLTPGIYSRFTSAVFADIHFNIRPEKKGQAFVFMDFGIDFYKHSNKYYYYSSGIYRARKDAGFYAGLGVAYMRRLTKRGSGIYVSYKILSNWYNDDRLDTQTLQPVAKVLNLEAAGVLSIGFKF